MLRTCTAVTLALCLGACQTYRGPYAIHRVKDPAACRKAERERASNLHDGVRMLPDGSCELYSIPN